MTRQSEQVGNAQGPPPIGLLVLTVLGLLPATACSCIGCFPLPVAAIIGGTTGSPYAAFFFLGAQAAGPVAILVAAGLCLWGRRPWGWRLAAGCQLLAAVIYALFALIGPHVEAVDPPQRGTGGPVGLARAVGWCLRAGVFPAAVSLTCFFYLLRPHVRAAFGLGHDHRNGERGRG